MELNLFCKDNENKNYLVPHRIQNRLEYLFAYSPKCCIWQESDDLEFFDIDEVQTFSDKNKEKVMKLWRECDFVYRSPAFENRMRHVMCPRCRGFGYKKPNPDCDWCFGKGGFDKQYLVQYYDKYFLSSSWNLIFEYKNVKLTKPYLKTVDVFGQKEVMSMLSFSLEGEKIRGILFGVNDHTNTKKYEIDSMFRVDVNKLMQLEDMTIFNNLEI